LGTVAPAPADTDDAVLKARAQEEKRRALSSEAAKAERRFQEQLSAAISAAVKGGAAAAAAGAAGEDSSAAPEGYVQRLTMKIVDNLEVTVRSVHVRYEDPESAAPEPPFACGITLDEFLIRSADAVPGAPNCLCSKLFALQIVCAPNCCALQIVCSPGT